MCLHSVQLVLTLSTVIYGVVETLIQNAVNHLIAFVIVSNGKVPKG